MPAKTRKIAFFVFAGLIGAVFITGCISRLNVFWLEAPLDWKASHRVGQACLVEFFSHRYPFIDAPPPGVCLMDSDTTSTAPFEILLNGKSLGQKPSSVADVIENGGGRYAYTDSFVFFSAPDNSPVRESDLYEARFPGRVNPWFLALLPCLLIPALIIKNRKSKIGGLQLLAGCCLLTGLALFALNLFGLLLPLRHPGLESDPRSIFGRNDISLPLEEALKSMARRPGEPDGAYALRAMGTVNRAMAHYWWEAGISTHRIRVPAWENYILYVMGILDRDYRFYVFNNPEKALTRGLGHCGQQATTLLQILRENRVPACMVNLGGHAVVSAEMRPGAWHILDPDFGVHVPLSLAELEKDPEKALPYYEKTPLYQIPMMPRRYMLDTIRGWYGPENNNIVCPGDSNWGFYEDRENFERLAYRLKWIIPAVLVLGAVLLALAARKRKRPAKPGPGKDAAVS